MSQFFACGHLVQPFAIKLNKLHFEYTAKMYSENYE